MVRTITAINVDRALHAGLWALRSGGVISDSRNGRVIRMPGPVVTEYLSPTQRLVSHAKRDANHVFHLMETIWMLAGEQNVEWLLPFNSKFGQYAEDDGRQHGAYGHRWRNRFSFDQLPALVTELATPNTRRAVLQMWNPLSDLGSLSRDVPCNTAAYFQVRNGDLQMTVTCRSNDVIWGAYGANAVHFSMLQELIAGTLGVGVGSYYQFSNDYHIYLEMGPGAALLDNPPPDTDAYHFGNYTSIPLLAEGETMWAFITDCEQFVRQPDPILHTHFMRAVAKPLKAAYLARKDGADWQSIVVGIPNCDWRQAFVEWASRRADK